MSFSEIFVNPSALSVWRGHWRHIQKWKVDFASATDYEAMDRERVDEWEKANAVSSEIVTWPLHKGEHAVLLDLDHRCWLFDSSSPGHYHLYIDVSISWRRYKKLLKALMRAGIIEKGYYKASISRGATFLRTPDTRKEL